MDKRITGCGLADRGQSVYINRRDMLDYALIAPVLPVREAHVTQIDNGHYSASTRLLLLDNIAVAQNAYSFPALVALTGYPGRLLFSIPMRWEGNLKINGHLAQPCQLHMADGELCLHAAGGPRETLAISVAEGLFLQTVAALTGYREEPPPCAARVLNLAPAAFARLCHAALKSVAPSLDGHPGIPFRQASSAMVFEALIDAYISAQPGQGMINQSCRYPSRIVRAAEERFEQSPERPISLAELCQAAGVSKNTLYRAFHSHCDMSPLEFIHKRRLNKARTRLVLATPARGRVKHAALSEGLAQLGRFSVEYRELFGESPSATLSRRPPAAPAPKRQNTPARPAN